MKKLWVTFLKDTKLSFNGLYFYIEIGMALIFIAIMLFIVPENFDQSQKLFLTFEGNVQNSGIFEELLLQDEAMEILDTREDLESAMKEDRTSMGFVIGTENDRMVYEMVLQGYESERMINLMKLSVESIFNGSIFQLDELVSEVQLEESPPKLTDREAILPIYIALNVGLMGLFIIAAYIFLDKEEGVIKAYAVAPVHIWQYLASKLLIMLLMGIITSAMTFLAIVRFDLNYLYLIALIIAFNLFGSSLGLFVASFFNTMVKAMGAMYGLIMLMILPGISYFMPAFNPTWIKVLPTYPMMFSIRDLLSRSITGTEVMIQTSVFLIVAFILFWAANLRFKKTLTV